MSFGTSNSMATLLFLSSVETEVLPGTSSTTNHKFHMALEQLHAPWCKPMSGENRYLVKWRPVGFVKARLNWESGGCETDAFKK